MSDEEDFESEKYDSDDDEEKMSENDAGKRAYHNLLERKRRDNIKDSFCQLRDVLPHFKKKKKASRVQILEKARSFIQKHGDIQALNEEYASMEEENKLLQKSLAEWDKAVENNDTETMAKLEAMVVLKRRVNLLKNDDTDSEEGESSDDSSLSPPQPSRLAVASSRRKFRRT